MSTSAIRIALHSNSYHLEAMFAAADPTDLAEGQLAYPRYHQMMCRLADSWGQPLERVIAAFVSLSPNNDYVSNLRSTVSVLEGLRQGIPSHRIVVSTYNHCKLRAIAYLRGEAHFVHLTRGLKILNFYHNLLDPLDPHWVTVDGHIVGAWQGLPLTMKEALISPRNYERVKARVIELAAAAEITPCAYQATVWFARKRTLRVKYAAQLSMFHDRSDAWRTLLPLEQIPPYPFAERHDDSNEAGKAGGRRSSTRGSTLV